jgi:hypothetical protein
MDIDLLHPLDTLYQLEQKFRLDMAAFVVAVEDIPLLGQ